MVDLGGGSTEFVLGNASGVIAAKSVDVGCVRLTERHLRAIRPRRSRSPRRRPTSTPPSAEAGLDVPLERATAVVGVAGSITTITAHALRLPEYSPAAIHGTELSIGRIQKAATDLLDMTREERAELPYMHPGRVDVIGAGGLVWRRILQRLADAHRRAASSRPRPVNTIFLTELP